MHIVRQDVLRVSPDPPVSAVEGQVRARTPPAVPGGGTSFARRTAPAEALWVRDTKFQRASARRSVRRPQRSGPRSPMTPWNQTPGVPRAHVRRLSSSSRPPKRKQSVNVPACPSRGGGATLRDHGTHHRVGTHDVIRCGCWRLSLLGDRLEGCRCAVRLPPPQLADSQPPTFACGPASHSTPP
jgi:hypothetical protein